MPCGRGWDFCSRDVQVVQIDVNIYLVAVLMHAVETAKLSSVIDMVHSFLFELWVFGNPIRWVVLCINHCDTTQAEL